MTGRAVAIPEFVSRGVPSDVLSHLEGCDSLQPGPELGPPKPCNCKPPHQPNADRAWQAAIAAASPHASVFNTLTPEQVVAVASVVEAAFAAGVASVDVAKIANHAHGMGQDAGARDAFRTSARILRQRAHDRIDAADGGSGAKALEQAAIVVEEQGRDL